MSTLYQQEFDFRDFMKRRGWNSVISIVILIGLLSIILIKTPVVIFDISF